MACRSPVFRGRGEKSHFLCRLVASPSSAEGAFWPGEFSEVLFLDPCFSPDQMPLANLGFRARMVEGEGGKGCESLV